MATRVKLTPSQKSKTHELRQYERALEELNHFYWAFRSSLQFVLPAMAKAKNVTDLIEGEVGQKLNMPAAKFIADAPSRLCTARHSFLVISVTIFEEYLREILTRILVTTWNLDKQYKVSFRPKELPTDLTLFDYLREKAIYEAVYEVLRKPYNARFESICQLIEKCGVSRPNLDDKQRELAVGACEARNCIVHASGKIDARARDALGPFIHGLAIGQRLNIEESLLWIFLGSLRDSVRVIDVAVRPLAKRPRGVSAAAGATG